MTVLQPNESGIAMVRTVCVWLTGLLIATAAFPALAAEDGGNWRRWAIICSPELQETGLGDLLTVELSKAKGIELVERDALKKVRAELKLTQLSGASNAVGRVKIGRMLKADALILLQRHGQGPKAPIRIIIAECLQGVRLTCKDFDFTTTPDKAAPMIAKIVHGTRKRFPDGVTLLVGVPNFVNRSLVRDQDKLQSDYANLLGLALSIKPGTAVLELEEARSITRELSGKELGRRRVPLIVRGQYRVESGGTDKPATVRIAMQLTGGTSSEWFKSPKLTLAKAPPWITKELPRNILQQAGVQEPLATEKQAKLLVEQADEFNRLGSYDQAAKLREAILLLNPDSGSQRTKLIGEYISIVSQRTLISSGQWYPGSPEIKAKFGRKVDLYLIALEHLEYLVRNRQIDRIQAVDLCGGIRKNRIDTRKVNVGRNQVYYLGQEEWARAQKPTRKFLLEVSPLFFDLPPSPDRPEDPNKDKKFTNCWIPMVRGGVSRRTDAHYLIARDLDDLFLACTEILPDRLSLYDSFGLPGPRAQDGPNAATDQDYMAFYQRLADSKHRSASLRGRFMLLSMKLELATMGPVARSRTGEARHNRRVYERYRLHKISAERGQEMLKEMQALSKECYRKDGGAESVSNCVNYRLRNLRKDIKAAIAPQEPGTPTGTPPGKKQVATPKRDQRPTVSKQPQKLERNMGALRFEHIPLKLRRRSGEIVEISVVSPGKDMLRSLRVLQCTKTADLFWNQNIVCLMRQPGTLTELYHDPQGLIRRLAFDGRNVWIARKDGSIHVISGTGVVRAKIDQQQGLPPSSYGPKLHPMAPGRVVALGSFGDPIRAWAATVSLEKGEDPEINVFFEAKKARPLRSRSFTSLPAINTGFHVGHIHAYQPKGQTERSVLLVERSSSLPLAIDLKTLKVTEFGSEYKHIRHCIIVASSDGMMFAASGGGLSLLAAPGTKWPDDSTSRSLPLTNPPATNPKYDDMKKASRLQYFLGQGDPRKYPLLDTGDGYLYYAGLFWHRIDLKKLTAEHLTSTWPTREYRSAPLGVSAHYGLYTWVQGTLRKITVDESAIPKKGDPIDK